LSEASFLTSRQLREAKGSLKGRDSRVPFLLVRFLWANKENEQSKKLLVSLSSSFTRLYALFLWA